jgi:DnaK suppressor protein
VEEDIGDEADVATRSVEREMLFELTDSEKQTLDMIEASLRKIEKGVFGRCESCQQVIARLRMDVMPWARYCISCQAKQEVPSGE